MIPLALHKTALAAFEAIINRALEFDPATQQRLAELNGKVIQVNVTLPAMTLVMICRGTQISLHTETEQPADVVLTGSATDLAGIAMADESQLAVAGSGVEIRGSLDTLQRLKNTLADLDIDWQAALAKLLGEIPAHLITQAARKAHLWQQDARARATAATSNFVINEAQLSPAPAEMEQFRLQTRQLATDVDRLAARVNRIKLQLSRQANQQDKPL